MPDNAKSSLVRVTRLVTLAIVAFLAGNASSGQTVKPNYVDQQNRTPEFAGRAAVEEAATFISKCDGFSLPETVIHDAQRDRYLVTCMVGNPTARDNNGEIHIIDPQTPGKSRVFIRGGTNGVTLHGPKGMAIHQNILWVVDIDMVRGFDADTGRPKAVIDLKRHDAVAINDIAIDQFGTIYVSDPRLIFDDAGKSEHSGEDRIFAVSSNRDVRTLVKSDDLSQPNGLAWDQKSNRLLVAPLNSTDVLSIDPEKGHIKQVASSAGRFDGIELLSNGSILVSCLREGTIRNVSNPSAEPVLSGKKYPGNFGIDRKRRHLLVPLITDGCVEVWKF